jgi:hypothetical protein
MSCSLHSLDLERGKGLEGMSCMDWPWKLLELPHRRRAYIHSSRISIYIEPNSFQGNRKSMCEAAKLETK